ncbi:MAG: hypothetical protein RI842_02715 [Schleiferiaceae bacterium]|nr:hypothetical protein [Schleiferiaceae bacterium]
MKKLLLLLTISFAFNTLAQKVRLASIQTIDDYQTALKIARDKEQMLLVVLYGSGGGLRQMYERDAFKDRKVEAALAPYLPLAIDVRKEMGSRWTELFPPAKLPAFYWLTEDEFLLALRGGVLPADSLAAISERQYQNRERFKTLRTAYQKNELSDGQWQELIRLHSLNFSFRETLLLALEYLNAQPESERYTPPQAALLTEYGLDLETPYPRQVAQHQKALEEALPDFTYADFYQKAYSYNLDLAIINEDSVLLQKIADELLPLAPSEKEKSHPVLATYRLYAQETGQYAWWRRGALTAAAGMRADSAGQLLYEEAFALADGYEDSSATEAAYHLAGAALEKKTFFKAAMLRAYLAHQTSRPEEARRALGKAAALAVTESERKNVAALRKMIQ